MRLNRISKIFNKSFILIFFLLFIKCCFEGFNTILNNIYLYLNFLISTYIELIIYAPALRLFSQWNISIYIRHNSFYVIQTTIKWLHSGPNPTLNNGFYIGSIVNFPTYKNIENFNSRILVNRAFIQNRTDILGLPSLYIFTSINIK